MHSGMLTPARLHELLKYNHETGTFTWAASRGPRRKGSPAGNIGKDGYVHIMIDGRNYLGHRLAWLYVHGEWPAGLLDHADRDTTNNAIGNLRLADVGQNRSNSRLNRTNTSGFKGVSWHKRSRRWVAFISIGGRNKNLGYFDEPELAAIAYQRAARQHHGDFAHFGK